MHAQKAQCLSTRVCVLFMCAPMCTCAGAKGGSVPGVLYCSVPIPSGQAPQ